MQNSENPVRMPPSANDANETTYDSQTPRPDVRETCRPLALFGITLLGGVLAWQLMDRFANTFSVPMLPEEMRMINPSYDENVRAAMLRNERHALVRNTALGIGLYGLAVGSLLGLAQPGRRKSAAACVLGVLIGAGCGAVFGTAGGLAGFLTSVTLEDRMEIETMYQTIAAHAATWAVTGIGIGLAASRMSRRRRSLIRTACASASAGLIAGFLYSPLAAVLFPTHRSDLPIPEGFWNRLFFATLASGLMAFAIARTQQEAEHSGTAPG